MALLAPWLRGGMLVDHFQMALDLQKEAVSFWVAALPLF